MSFDVAPEAYNRFVGRFSEPLAAQFAALAVKEAEHARALDVGCGPGALTAELVVRLGERSVVAVDPSASFVEAMRSRFPGVEVHRASAESLPFPNDAFDVSLAQLVVHFMTDPVGGIREMARVTRTGGVVGASVWDYGGGRSPLTVFWRAVAALDPGARDESERPGGREGHLAEMFEGAGLRDIDAGSLAVSVDFAGFDEWWEPYTFGVGPAGAYVAQLDGAGRARLRARCAELLPDGPFTINAVAWTVLGRV